MGFFDSIADIIPGAISGIGDVLEWGGQRTGIKPLENLGAGTHNFMNTGGGRTLANLAAAVATPFAMSYMPTNWASAMPSWLQGTGAATEGAATAGTSGSILSGAPAPAMDTLASGGATFGNATPFTNAITGGSGAGMLPAAASAVPAGGAAPSGSKDTGFLSSLMNSGKSMVSDAMPTFGAASELGGGAMQPSTLSSLSGGINKYALPLMGLGLGTDLFAQMGNVKQEKGEKDALNAAIAANSWTPERRAEYMKGVNSELAGLLGGARRRAGAGSAARGGAGAPEMLQRASSDAYSGAVKNLASTFAPDANLISPTAQANSPTKGAGSRWLSDIANLAGSGGSSMMQWAMLKDILGR